MNCLQNFSAQEVLNKHKETCLLINDNITPIFEKGIIKFNNYDKQLPIPFKIYADIECYNKKINIQKGKSTKLYSKHIPNSTGAKLVCIDHKYTKPIKIFEGKNCINKFLKWIFKTKILCNDIIKNKFNKDLIMTNEDEEKYKSSNICWICKEIIKDNKVRDHCHITGMHRDAAHKKCNLKLVISKKIPILFLNFEGYDGHIIFKELNNFKNINTEVIPKSTEKYMSIIINRDIIFLDSMQFLNKSLDALSNNLEDTDHKYLPSEFKLVDLNLLKKKDPYPYEWVNS